MKKAISQQRFSLSRSLQKKLLKIEPRFWNKVFIFLAKAASTAFKGRIWKSGSISTPIQGLVTVSEEPALGGVGFCKYRFPKKQFLNIAVFVRL